MPFAFGNIELLDLKVMYVRFQEVAEGVLLHSMGKSERISWQCENFVLSRLKDQCWDGVKRAIKYLESQREAISSLLQWEVGKQRSSIAYP